MLEAVPFCAEEPMGVPVREGTDGLVVLLMEEVVVLDPPTRILGDGGPVVAVVLLLLLVVLVVITVEGGARTMSPLLKFCSALVVDEKGPRTGMTEEEEALPCCTTWEISFRGEENKNRGSGLGGERMRHACWGVNGCDSVTYGGDARSQEGVERSGERGDSGYGPDLREGEQGLEEDERYGEKKTVHYSCYLSALRWAEGFCSLLKLVPARSLLEAVVVQIPSLA